MPRSLIGLLDCNNFFVSCERLFRPDLIGKPVIVLSSNDGCVVARSQEVKDIGVPMGVPYFKIKDIVKKHSITTFSSHFALYRDISRRVFLVMREVLDEVEQYSIDEAFFTVSGDPEEVARSLKQSVEQYVGIPVSVGVAVTKTQAKYANQLAKKSGGIKVLLESEWRELSPRIPLANIWGVGGKMELKYKQYGLVSVADVLQADRARIDRLFGVSGLRLQQELAGVPNVTQRHTEPQQSIMSSRSFRDTTTDIAVLADAVAYHVRQVSADLRRLRHGARVLRVSIQPSRHGDFLLRGGAGEVVLPAPTANTFELIRVANTLLHDLFEAGVPYKKVGVVVSDLCSTAQAQATLFADQKTTQTEAVLAVMDQLNARAGKETVLLGSHLHTAAWRVRSESCSPAYTTRWSEIAHVKAR